MALTRITKGVIKPNENYDTHNIVSTGIVTSVGLDVNGNADISGNLSVGGVLTYEDVASIDSVGIITARDGIHVGAGVSVVGIVTASTFKGDGDFVDIDVDGHTNLDNVSVAGVTTHYEDVLFQTANGNNIYIDKSDNSIRLGDSVPMYFGTNKMWLMHNGSTGYLNNVTGSLYIRNESAGDVYIQGKAGEHSIICNDNGAVELYHDNIKRLETSSVGVSIPQDLDVDGHTNLDNVSIAGVTTMTGNLSMGETLTVSGDNPNITFTDTNSNPDYKIYGSNGAFTILDSTNGVNRFAISSIGNISISNDLDVDGHTNLDNVSIAGVSTFSGILDATNTPASIRVAQDIQHKGDADTKITFPAADQISFETAGTNRLKIHTYSSNNNVEVDASAHLSLADNGSNGRFIYIGDGDASSTGYMHLQPGGGSQGFGGGIRLYSHSNSTNAGGVYIGKSHASSGAIIFGNGGMSPLNEYARFTSAGQLVMGASISKAKFEIKDNGYSSSTVLQRISGDDANPYALIIANDTCNTAAASGLQLFVSDSGEHYIRARASSTAGNNNLRLSAQNNVILYSGSSETERLRITSSGQLLLGETSAFDSNTAIQFRKDNAGGTSDFIFRNRGDNNNSRVQLKLTTLNRAANADVHSGIEKYQSGGMAIYNGENTNQYSNINFFTNGWRSLQLRNGNHSGAWCAEIDAYWGTSNGLRMEVGGPQSGTWQAIDFHTSHTGTQRGYIGVTYGGVSYNSSSDYRMKQDVVDMTGAIDRIKLFLPKRFKWKEDPTHTVDGFLAHEAATVVPESVQGEKDGEQMQVMDNSKLVPVLTAALKEAIAKIEILEAKVAALESS